MARRNNHELAFAALSIEGALLAPDFLNKVAHLDATEQSETDYDIPRGLKLRDEIGRYWKIAQNLWQDFSARRERADVDSHTVTVRDFLEPFCRQVLGFADMRAVGQVTLDERIFPIGFAAADGRVPLVFAAHKQELDKPSIRHGDGVHRRSPFLLAQEYLNANDDCLWALVSNGLKLRILRDNPSLTRPAYIEADLEAIFNEGLYPDFTALWLLAQASRFGKVGIEPADCALERWRNTAQEDGIRARVRLRVGVTEALRALGTGFLAHKDNVELRRRIETGELSTQAYFEQLLRLIYRFIFLATIEDRELVFAPDAGPEIRERYLSGYSLTRLRRLAARRRAYDRHTDLWQVLTITIDGLGRGQPALGLPALGGLFDAAQCPEIGTAHLENQALLSALFSLCFFRDGVALSRVNYRDMDSEELGSVYESLLELVPQVTLTGGARKFGFIGDEEEGSTKGNARKLTGSYYTPDSLVQELIKSALEPVIARTLAENPQEPVKALLELTVCDPACGSGHFLLAAARRIADEVALLRAKESSPAADDFRHALRDVVAHCIYGVDKNQMAVELARTALWLEAYTPDRPLTFLDAHLRCGDALLGVLDDAILQDGIPDKAFNALSGDDKEVVKCIKKANRDALKAIVKAKEKSHRMLSLGLGEDIDAAAFEALPDDTLEALQTKRAAHAALEANIAASRARLAADIFVAAFVLPKTAENEGCLPTSQDLWLVLNGDEPRPHIAESAHKAARAAQTFHWWQAFPQVKAKGGFDVLLGNPPWEMLQLDPQEFFASRAPSVANAQHMAARDRLIAALEHENPNLFSTYWTAVRTTEAVQSFVHESGRFPTSSFGRVNLAYLFAEHFLDAKNPRGRAGFIVPSGIATDSFSQHLFNRIADGNLISFFDIENKERLFPAVDSRMKFCLLTLGQNDTAEFVCFASQTHQLTDSRRRFKLSPSDFELLNPNTRTCPVFRTNADAELTKKIYRRVPVLYCEPSPSMSEANHWGLQFMLMFMMNTDSYRFHNALAPGRLPLCEAKMIHQFDHRWASYVGNSSSDVTVDQKKDPNYSITPRYWVDAREVWLRIARLPDGLMKALKYGNTETIILCVTQLLFGWHLARLRRTQGLEGAYSAWKAFVSQHPYAKYVAPVSLGLVGNNPASLQPLNGDYLPAESEVKLQPYTPGAHSATAWYAIDSAAENAMLSFTTSYAEQLPDPAGQLVNDADVLALAELWLEASCPKWLMGWRDICRATDERTVIASVVPRGAAGDTLLLMFPDPKHGLKVACLLAEQCTLVHDYVARQKVGGTHLKFHVKKQLPSLPPDSYTDTDVAFVVPRVLELTYTAHDLKPWAEDLGYDGPPFPWNTERRAQLRAELDAYYARLYGLTRDELRYILDPADVMGVDYPSETFRVLKNNEMREFGEYRTQRLVLAAWDRLQGNFKDECLSVLEPAAMAI